MGLPRWFPELRSSGRTRSKNGAYAPPIYLLRVSVGNALVDLRGASQRPPLRAISWRYMMVAAGALVGTLARKPRARLLADPCSYTAIWVFVRPLSSPWPYMPSACVGLAVAFVKATCAAILKVSFQRRWFA